MKLLQKLYQTLKQFILETLVQFKNLPTRIWRNLEETGEWLQNLLTGDDDTRDRLKEYFQWHGKEIFFCFLLAFLIAGVDKVQQFFDAFAQEIIQGGSSFDHFSLAFVGNGVVIFWLCYVFWHKPKRTTLLVGLFGKKRADNYRAYYQRKGNVWRVSATASIPLLLAGAGLAQSILKNESYRTPKEFVPKLAIAINAHPFITLMAVMLLFLILSLILAPRIRSNASLSNRHQTLWRNLFFMSLSILVLTWLFYHYQYQKGHVIYKGSALLLLVFWPPIMLTFLLNSFSDCLVKSSEILAEKQIEGAQTARRFNRVYDALMWSSYLFSGTALVLINIASVTTSAWFSMLVFPIAMLIFIAIVYYQAIDWLSYNMSRLRFSLLLGAMLGLMWFGPQKHYELKFKAPQQSQAVKRISLEDYFLAWLRDRVERGAIMRSDTIYLVSSEGGGSRSGAWTSAILTGLDQRLNGMFQERCLAISTVSGGSIGAATTLSLWDNAKILNIPPASLYGDDSTRTRYIHTIFKRNYISSALAGLFFYDGFQQNILFSWLYPNSLSRTDRQQLEENDAMNRAFKAVFGVDKPLNSDYFLKSDFVGRYYVGQTETPRVDMPLFFPNTCRVEEGR
ncbi:MAG: hypothetical protein JNN28_10995, partial [Saprospiraceae bacterium]|nr:hypothetical protein [Saprospiraceae bacterium]